MKRAISIGVFLAVQLSASAFAGGRFIGDVTGDGPYRHWFGASMPITVTFDSSTYPGSPANRSTLVGDALQSWEDIACTSIDFEPAVAVQDFTANWVDDSFNAQVWNDPSDLMATGTLAATVTWYDNLTSETINNYTWRRITNFDVAWNNGITWGTPAQVDDPSCVGLTDLQSVALHEIGHGIGYGHPCDRNESCPETEKVSSIMFWSIGSCSNKRTPASYDLESHSIAYGLGTVSSFSGNTPTGPTPLDVTFTPATYSSASIVSTTWSFGDGATETVTAPPFTATHEYVAEGRYTVNMTINGSLPACGGPFTHDVRKVNYVTACNALVPAFTHETDGKRIQFHSTTEGSAAGCLQTLEWDFGDGTTSNVKDPIHDYAEGGTYTVTLTARGPGSPAGVMSAPVSVKTGGGGGGCGCDLEPGTTANSTAAAGALLAALVMSVAATRRRSRG